MLMFSGIAFYTDLIVENIVDTNLYDSSFYESVEFSSFMEYSIRNNSVKEK